MNAKRTLIALTTALTLGLSAGQSLADNGYFGVSILDDAQHDYVVEDKLDNHGYENPGSATPFSDFGVAILDGAEHDYVLDNSSDDLPTQTIAQSDPGDNEFGVAILDDSIHDYVRDDAIGDQSSELIFASTTKDSDADQGNRHPM